MLLSRLPWLGPGHGSDPDCYRVANAATQLGTTGGYVASRLPGYPVHEYLVALVREGGPEVCTGLSAAATALAAAFFFLMLTELEVRGAFWASLAMAFTPVVYVASVSTIDYSLALAALLGSTWLLLRRRYLGSGVLLGLAVGCRITSGLIGLPFAAYLLSRREPWRRLVGLSLMAAAVAVACYAPVLGRYGLAFWSYVEPVQRPGVAALAVKATAGVWGTLGILAWAFAAVAAVARARPTLERRRREPSNGAVILSGTVVAVYTALFVRLPLESGYLIPIVPFFLLLGASAVPRRAFVACCGLLCLSPFVTAGRHGVRLAGPLLEDHAQRENDLRLARRVLAAARKIPESSALVCGSYLPLIEWTLGAKASAGPRLLYLIESETDAKALTAAGHSIFFLPGQEEFNERARGVDLRGRARVLPGLDAEQALIGESALP